MKKISKLIVGIMVISGLSLSLGSCGGNNEDYGPTDSTDTYVALHNIMTRTSVRQYTGKQIPQDTITTILKAGMAAPSAMNKQPWKFVVVSNLKLRNRLGDAIQGVGDKAKTAGAVIVVCGDSEKFIEEAPEYWVQDCSAASENILLAVNALNLGGVWCGVYPNMDRVAEVQEILGLQKNLIPLNVITIGYPTALQSPKDKWDENNIINK